MLCYLVFSNFSYVRRKCQKNTPCKTNFVWNKHIGVCCPSGWGVTGRILIQLCSIRNRVISKEAQPLFSVQSRVRDGAEMGWEPWH